MFDPRRGRAIPPRLAIFHILLGTCRLLLRAGRVLLGAAHVLRRRLHARLQLLLATGVHLPIAAAHSKRAIISKPAGRRGAPNMGTSAMRAACGANADDMRMRGGGGPPSPSPASRAAASAAQSETRRDRTALATPLHAHAQTPAPPPRCPPPPPPRRKRARAAAWGTHCSRPWPRPSLVTMTTGKPNRDRAADVQ